MVKIDSEYKVHGSMVRKRIGETLHDVGGKRGEARRGRGGGGGGAHLSGFFSPASIFEPAKLHRALRGNM